MSAKKATPVQSIAPVNTEFDDPEMPALIPEPDIKPLDEESVPWKLRPVFDTLLNSLQRYEQLPNYKLAKIKKEISAQLSEPFFKSSRLISQFAKRLRKITRRQEMLAFLNRLVYDFDDEFHLEIHRQT